MEIEILRLQAKQLLSEYMNLDKISANIGLLLCVQTLFQVEFNFFFRLGSLQFLKANSNTQNIATTGFFPPRLSFTMQISRCKLHIFEKGKLAVTG